MITKSDVTYAFNAVSIAKFDLTFIKVTTTTWRGLLTVVSLHFMLNHALSQRDRATHELLRFAKLRSGIFEPLFLGA